MEIAAAAHITMTMSRKLSVPALTMTFQIALRSAAKRTAGKTNEDTVISAALLLTLLRFLSAPEEQMTVSHCAGWSCTRKRNARTSPAAVMQDYSGARAEQFCGVLPLTTRGRRN